MGKSIEGGDCGHCPKCGPDRFAKVLYSNHKFVPGSRPDISWTTYHRMMSCLGCGTTYFQVVETCTEWPGPTIKHWPAPLKRERPKWFALLHLYQDGIEQLLDSVYVALDNNLSVLAAIGVRTVFDRCTELLEVDPAISFQEKLHQLFVKGKVGAEEKESLATLADAGSAAAHRGWKPSEWELDTLMSTIEHFIYRNFVLPKEQAVLRHKVPRKPARKKV